MSPLDTPADPQTTTHPTFISCDWGTTNFRLSLVADLSVGSQVPPVTSADGCRAIAALHPAGPQREAAYAQVLRDGVAELAARAGHSLAAVPIVISGMPSSSIGWRELPYARTPFALDGSDAQVAHLQVDGLGPILLISGVADQDDVMRGEETELIGLLAEAYRANPDTPDLYVIMPGTHSKHVLLAGGRIVRFHTAMTGELYDLLANHSVLASVMKRVEPDEDAAESKTFPIGVEESAAQNILQILFRPRVRALLQRWTPGECRGYLSGALIAAELRGLDALGTPVMVAAGGKIAARYLEAWTLMGYPAERIQHLDMARVAMRGQATLLASHPV